MMKFYHKAYAKAVDLIAKALGDSEDSVAVADVIASIALLVLVLAAFYLFVLEGI